MIYQYMCGSVSGLLCSFTYFSHTNDILSCYLHNQNLTSARTSHPTFFSFYIHCFCFLLLATLVFNTNFRIKIHKNLIEILTGIILTLYIDLEKTDIFNSFSTQDCSTSLHLCFFFSYVS